jgi:hypothetical protein
VASPLTSGYCYERVMGTRFASDLGAGGRGATISSMPSLYDALMSDSFTPSGSARVRVNPP